MQIAPVSAIALNSLVPSAVEEFVAKPRFDHQDRAAAAAGEVVGSVARVLLNSSEAARLAARAPPPGSYTLPSFFDDVDRQRQAGMCDVFNLLCSKTLQSLVLSSRLQRVQASSEQRTVGSCRGKSKKSHHVPPSILSIPSSELTGEPGGIWPSAARSLGFRFPGL